MKIIIRVSDLFIAVVNKHFHIPVYLPAPKFVRHEIKFLLFKKPVRHGFREESDKSFSQ